MGKVQVPSTAEVVALGAHLGKMLQAANMMCAIAESCTGGLIAHILTETPGSSAYLAGAAVVYSYPAKERVLGVRHESLMMYGAVSHRVAQEMAVGALRLYDADVAISVTGIAGPGGGMPDKPTGTVYFHLVSAAGAHRPKRVVWEADRSGNKLLSAQAAIQMMLDYVNESVLSCTL
jgi:PncC family amidohydrolase